MRKGESSSEVAASSVPAAVVGETPVEHRVEEED